MGLSSATLASSCRGRHAYPAPPFLHRHTTLLGFSPAGAFLLGTGLNFIMQTIARYRVVSVGG